jgi:hypothetical protein
MGNNVNININTTLFQSPSFLTYNTFKPDMIGNGFNAAANAGCALGATNTIFYAFPFYDNGLYSYSAITYGVSTSAASHSYNVGFYDSQYIPGQGIAPNNLLFSGISLPMTSTGVQTVTISPSISFSGYGPGVYWIGYTLVRPSGNFGAVPYGSSQINYAFQSYLQQMYGMFFTVANTTIPSGLGYKSYQTSQPMKKQPKQYLLIEIKLR